MCNGRIEYKKYTIFFERVFMSELMLTDLTDLEKESLNYDVLLQDIEQLRECLFGDYQTFNGCYYNSETYFIAEDTGTIEDRDTCQYCEGCDSNYSENFDFYDVYTGRYEIRMCNNCRTNEDIFETRDGQFYTRDGMEYHNLVRVEDSDYIHHIDNVTEHDGDYYINRPINCNADYRDSYHDCNRVIDCNALEQTFRVGFEIEKEDESILTSIDLYDFKKACKGWIKESDGSLDEDSGYELVSPCLGFSNITDVKVHLHHIEKNRVLKSHIDAKFSTNCGGHIHFSHKNMSTGELFMRLEPFLYLTYAMFPKRANQSTCQSMSSKELLDQGLNGEKYLAWRVTRQTIEMRIFSAVRSFDHLRNRFYFVFAMLNNFKALDTCESLLEALTNRTNKDINRWLDSAYSDNLPKLERLIVDYKSVIKQYETPKNNVKFSYNEGNN